MSTEIEDQLYRETLPNIYEVVKRKTKKYCTPNTLMNFFPVIKWLPNYQLDYVLKDCIAGLTVGLTCIPQAIAYGAIAGLEPQYGLYSAFMGCFMYIIFGTCKDVTVGPTAIMALMVQHVAKSADYVVLLCFISGCIITLMGLLNLGILVQFISMPVTTGFITAAAVTIASGQINNLFGISSSSNEFFTSWYTFFGNITKLKQNDSILGVCTLIVLILMKQMQTSKCVTPKFKKLIYLISLSRNALAVIVGIILCYCLSHDDVLPFRVNGKITKGIPPFQLPPFSTTNENGETVSFTEMFSELTTSIVTIPLVSVVESIAVAKAFSKGKIVDYSQEMIALGLGNIMGSFVSSMPITGSFTRTAINNSSGVKTQFGGLVTGGLVLLALSFLTNTFYYIPKATLAAIIIAAMIFMIEYHRILEIWNSKKLDVFPYVVTVIVCLFWSLEGGIIVGIIFNLIFILYRTARPRITTTIEKVNDIEIGIVKLEGEFRYCCAEYLRMKIINFKNTQATSVSLIMLQGEDIKSIDSTVAMNILSLKEDLILLNCELFCWNWNYKSAGVLYRLNPNARGMFKFDITLQEIIDDIKGKNSRNHSLV
ncbi:sodium-independent sulfate anion transporter [Teleopsis dalmanni]|uniref:sodium-independent sulfate anion transporter n=1 Tax=Teleopsis dalmanni TaxID=139649 RepID=UPI0018CCE0B1|nr:sodium-independent sulfate anion transporter [Teleopsis dalmanni]